MANYNETQREIITDKPSKIAEIIRKARGHCAFFVCGDTPLLIDGGDTYLPLSGNVRVTRRAMLDYLRDISETAERAEKQRGVSIVVKLSVVGHCYFV